ncbi:MAG: arsenic resistance N-acetyltransferase ArsN2 [Gemmatimonadales bacterium]|nr:arsenic resistance N-acetyltransferase ArsN2 [Gemmatimonadales bacterium]
MPARVPVPAKPADAPAVTVLLAEAKLPVADLSADRMAGFLMVRSGELLEGVVALEEYGASGLLRSLAVAPATRGTGLGKHLVAALEDRARGRGIAELWLLTTTAAGFFAKAGYRVAERSSAPEAVRGSTEFASLCPSSAVCMVKVL